MAIQLNNTNDLNLLRDRVEEALAAVGKDLGVNLSLGSGTYEPDGSGCRFKMEARRISEDGSVETKEARAFKDAAQYLEGFEASDLGRTIQIHGKQYKLSGWLERGRKFKFIADDAEGRTFKFPFDVVVAALKAANERVAATK